MPVDVRSWRRVVKEVVDGIADEQMQRRAWFGIGPEESSPDEELNAFFGDAAVEDFLSRDDAGLTETQRKAGHRLVELMRELSRQTPDHIEPADLINDPRWARIREAAAQFSRVLENQQARGS